jgi:hypothetical protein
VEKTTYLYLFSPKVSVSQIESFVNRPNTKLVVRVELIQTRLPDSPYPKRNRKLCNNSLCFCLCVMLLMAVQPNLNASLKPLPFPSQKVKPFFEKPSIFAYPKTKTISFSNLKLTRQCHTHTHTHTTKFVKQVWASATAEATVAEEGTVSDDDFASVSPPDKEV